MRRILVIGFRGALGQPVFLDGFVKQMALEKTTHDWVLLLDADEALSRDLQSKIRQVLASGPAADVRHSTPGTIILADV